MFTLLSDQSLFNVNQNDDLVKGEWNEVTKGIEFAMIGDLVAQDLLSKLLCRNAKGRLSTYAILDHQFIKCEGADSNKNDEELVKMLDQAMSKSPYLL